MKNKNTILLLVVNVSIITIYLIRNITYFLHTVSFTYVEFHAIINSKFHLLLPTFN